MGELADAHPPPGECRRRAIHAAADAPAGVAAVVWALLAIAGELAALGRDAKRRTR